MVTVIKKAAVAAFLQKAGRSAGSRRTRTDFAELLAEFLDATCGIHDLVLTRVERMGFSRHLQLDQRIFLAFEIDGVLGLDGGAGNEFEIAGKVVEYDFAIIRVDAFFHDVLKRIGSQSPLRRSLLPLDPIADHLPVEKARLYMDLAGMKKAEAGSGRPPLAIFDAAKWVLSYRRDASFQRIRRCFSSPSACRA